MTHAPPRFGSRDVGPVEVFVSYKWGGAAQDLVDEIELALSERGVEVRRDRSEMHYRDSIQRFMRALGAGKYVIVALDDAYLRSPKCMFELTEIADRPDFAKRIFPIVLPDANITDPRVRIGYIRFWEQMRDDLARDMSTVKPEYLHGIREDLDRYEKIRNTIDGITDVLADMNTLTPEAHRDSVFDQIYAAITR
jgi:internalin A